MQTRSSGYDVPEEWMYFKAGAYLLNRTGESDDFDEVTFYALENKHDF
jgi:poly(beta-D-mannuronate) lyase